jgi:signal transduction histidine kinase
MPLDDRSPAAAPEEKPRSLYMILHLAGYLTVAGVAVAELLEIPVGPRFAWTAGLLAAFAVLLVVIFRTEGMRGKAGFLAAAIAASAIGIAIMAVGSTPIFGAILFFVLCTIVGMRLSLGIAVAWVSGATAALLVCLLVLGHKDWLPTMASFGAGFFAFVAFSVAFRRSLQARAESQQLLAELMSVQGRLRDMAVMEERQRLAREMHDAVGHRLTAAAVLLEGAARLIGSEPARATRMVETSRVQVRQGLDDLRGAVSALRTEALGMQSLPEVLAALVDVFAQGAEAKVTLDLQPGMSEPEPERKRVIVRTAQEALTNVQKHAAATRVELALKTEGGSYVLTCRDNGQGLSGAGDAQSVSFGTGFGLDNMRTRAAAFGGSVDLEPVPDGGTLLRLTLPGAGGAANA